MIRNLLLVVGLVLLSWFLVHRFGPWAFRMSLRLVGIDFKVSPAMARRVQRFRRIKRGYFAYVAITTAFALSLFLEVLVNDKAILIVYEDHWAAPAVSDLATNLIPFAEFSSYERASDYDLPGGERPINFREFAALCDDPGRFDALIAEQTALRDEKLERIQGNLPDRPEAPPSADGVSEEDRASHIEDPAPYVAELDRRSKAAYEDGDDDLGQELEDLYFEWDDYLADLDAYREARGEFDKQFADVEMWEEQIRDLEATKAKFAAGEAWIWLPPYPYHPLENYLGEVDEPNAPYKPRWTTFPILGTTEPGQDIFCQIVYGFRVSLLFALIVATIGYTVGVIVGGIMGYYGGWIDIVLQRVVEIWGSIPFLFTMMILASIIHPNIFVLAVMLIILRSWLGITYTIRGEFYREKAKDYVLAAVAMGQGDWRIMTRHILPNALVPVVTFAPFGIVAYIFTLVSLDFLGFGLPPTVPSWGRLLHEGQEFVTGGPYIILSAAFALMTTLFLVVMIGEAVREAFDPKVYS